MRKLLVLAKRGMAIGVGEVRQAKAGDLTAAGTPRSPLAVSLAAATLANGRNGPIVGCPSGQSPLWQIVVVRFSTLSDFSRLILPTY